MQEQKEGGIIKAPTWLCGYKYEDKVFGRKSKKIVKGDEIEFYVTNDFKDSEFSRHLLEKVSQFIRSGGNIVLPTRHQQIVQIAAKLNSNIRLYELLRSIQYEVCELVGAEAASILLFKKDHLEFMVTAGGASGKIESIPVPMESIAGTIFLNGKAMIFNDLKKDSRHFKGVDKAAKFVTKNIVGSPIWVDNEKIGVIEVLNKDGGFDEEDAKDVETFSKLIGKKLLSTWKYEQFSKELKTILLAIADAIDKRDNYTHQHSKNVALYSVEIARKVGLSQEKLEKLEFSAILHDVGKIGIPDRILRKPGKLTDEEFAYIKNHTVYGAEILSHIRYVDKDIISGALEHHEKLDGSGYPYGKKGEEIGLFGRIIAVADIFDALSSKRTYKEGWQINDVIKILKEDSQKGKLDEEFVKVLEEYLIENGLLVEST